MLHALMEYTMAMMMTAANVARGMILRGLRVSSPKMAVASKPMKHRKAKHTPNPMPPGTPPLNNMSTENTSSE